jgi:hypothetical protein
MKLESKKPRIGTKRIRKSFLWFPKYLENSNRGKYIFRWLEKAEWQQEYTYYTHSPVGWYDDRWDDI